MVQGNAEDAAPVIGHPGPEYIVVSRTAYRIFCDVLDDIDPWKAALKKARAQLDLLLSR